VGVKRGSTPLRPVLRVGFITEIIAPGKWTDRVGQLADFAQTLPARSLERLLAVTAEANDDGDLAELARSAAHPGLKHRIQSYLAEVK
jgi:hypothetical protein